jgi:UDP-N-acetylglucosamine 4,6-dehydratase
MRQTGRLPITDTRMTRFWITLDQGVQFVIDSLGRMHGGELFVPKIPSADIMTVAKAIAPECRADVVGIRPGEKVHELMIGEDDARRTRDMGDYYVVQPDFPWWDDGRLEGGTRVSDGFSYRSDTNDRRLNCEEVRGLLGRLGFL